MKKFMKKNKLNHEINIIPLMDIILVLLVIFMLFAMNIISSLQVNLPSAKSSNTQNDSKNTIILVQSNGDIFLNDKKVSVTEMEFLLSKMNKKNAVSIFADRKLEYGVLAKILGILQVENFSNINLAINKS